MRYRVTFAERTKATGEPSERPPESFDSEVADGVVLDKVFVERDEPLGMHGSDTLSDEDTFLSVGSETWDYDIAQGREDEFVAAVTRSPAVLEYTSLSTSLLEDSE